MAAARANADDGTEVAVSGEAIRLPSVGREKSRLVHRRRDAIMTLMARNTELTDAFGLRERDHVEAIWTAVH